MPSALACAVRISNGAPATPDVTLKMLQPASTSACFVGESGLSADVKHCGCEALLRGGACGIAMPGRFQLVPGPPSQEPSAPASPGTSTAARSSALATIARTRGMLFSLVLDTIPS